MMDITMYNSAKALFEAGVRQRNSKPDPATIRTIPPDAIKKLSAEDAAALGKSRAEDDKRLAEAREQLIQRTGIDPQTIPFKYERRPPMTEEEGAAYVQGVLDQMVAADAWHQQHLAEYAKYKADILAKSQQTPQIDTSA
jgi:hypothetical protein